MAFPNTTPLGVERAPISALKPSPRNARSHSKRQIDQIAASIREFGFTNPVLVDEAKTILAGHGRVEAARRLGLEEIPILRIEHLSPDQKRAYVIADNQLALKAGWDKEILAIELEALVEAEFEVELIGFEIAEIDAIIGEGVEADPDGPGPEDRLAPSPSGPPVTRAGDVWALGRHRLICGDARETAATETLMQGAPADLMFADPPYNVPIDGHVSGHGAIKHREFAMGVGEMSREAFVAFLRSGLAPSAAVLKDGAISFVCMDWRHMGEAIEAGTAVFDAMKNLCVWAKTNAGMGSFYRSQHELVFVFKKGGAAHENTFGLGETGRHRSNLWTYAAANGFSRDRAGDLAMHPTVKPVALVEDAIRDVSRRGQIVLDPFGGSGSTLIAAEKCGRLARLIELDPLYCDVIVRRWQSFTGKKAVLAEGGESFETVAERRAENTEAAA